MLSIRIAFQKLASSPLMASGTWCRGLHLVPLVGVRMTNSKLPSASQESCTFGLRLYPQDKPEDLARDESEELPRDERYDAALAEPGALPRDELEGCLRTQQLLLDVIKGRPRNSLRLQERLRPIEGERLLRNDGLRRRQARHGRR